MARSTPPATKIVKALISLMLEYKWQQFVLLTEKATTFQQISDAVQVSEGKGVHRLIGKV